MNISKRGLALIREFEGCELTAYKDVGGVLTIGVGHTGFDVKTGQCISDDEANQLLAKDCIRAEHYVNALVTVPINQNQFDALVSFVFNLGAGALEHSTLLSLLNDGDYKGAQDQFIKWCHDNGKVVSGLVRRRDAEADLFGAKP